MRNVPARMTAAPPIMLGVTGSRRKSSPQSMANTGTRKVTVRARVAPTCAMSL